MKISNISDDVVEYLKNNLPVILDSDDIVKVLKVSNRTAQRIIHELKKENKIIKTDNHAEILRDDFIEYIDKINF